MTTLDVLAHLKSMKSLLDRATLAARRIDRQKYDSGQYAEKERKDFDAVSEFLSKQPISAEILNALSGWLIDHQRASESRKRGQSERLGSELEQLLSKVNIRLSGQIPLLRAGFFNIEVKPGKDHAVIWFGPEQERLEQCALNAGVIADLLIRTRDTLGAGLTPEDFKARLVESYRRSLYPGSSGPAPICRVLAEMAWVLQDEKFRTDPRKALFRGYSRADFSFDLFRMRQSNSQLRLSVATRSQTRRRADFLWIPDDDTGKGTTYSRLQLEED